MNTMKLILLALCAVALVSASSLPIPRSYGARAAKRGVPLNVKYVSVGNYSSFTGSFVIPPAPFRDPNALGYYDLEVALQNAAGTDSLWLYYSPFIGRNNATTYTVSTCGYNSCSDSEGNYYANPGDLINFQIYFADKTWYINGYVNGVLQTRHQIATYTGVRFTIGTWPYSEIATNADTATQGYLALKEGNFRDASSRTFTIGNDSYIYLTSNPTLVLDVSGGVAKEGARLVVFPKKTPAATNQQWEIINGTIYSKLANKAFSVGFNALNQIILTKLTRNVWNRNTLYNQWAINNKTPHAASARVSLVTTDLECNWLPPSNKLDITNIVLKTGTQQVTPTWTGGVITSACQITGNATSNSIKLAFNSAA